VRLDEQTSSISAPQNQAGAHGATLRFIGLGNPIDNAYVESVNGKFRDERLNETADSGESVLRSSARVR
jgi:hypothetical protein